jgi:phytanoyl-CoA hydroxylase
MVSAELLRRYRRDGYVVIERLVPDKILQALRRKTDELVEQSCKVTETDAVFELGEGHSAAVPRVERIKAPHAVDPLYRDLIHRPEIIEVLKALLGPDVRLQNSKLNLKSSGGAAVEWHQDWAFYPHTNDDVLAVGVMLDDMTLDNGPLMVVPASHTGPLYDHHCNGFFCGAIADEVAEGFLARAVPITGPAGSVSFHHARLLHGSDTNRSGRPRRLLLYEAMAADAWPLAGGFGRFQDWEEFKSRMISGRQPLEPRLAPVPVRMPQPLPERATSIFALQKQGEHKLYFKKAAPAT